jgi:hypothetical protein
MPRAANCSQTFSDGCTDIGDSRTIARIQSMAAAISVVTPATATDE